jgi:hypothetical protein
LLKNINPECYSNDDCEYDNNDIVFAVQHNESFILFLLYTPTAYAIQEYIHEYKSRISDKDFEHKTFCKWFEKNQLQFVSMFLVEQFYFLDDDE